MSQMKSAENLGDVAINSGIVAADVYNRVLAAKEAKEVNNAHGKFINAVRAAVEAAVAAGLKPNFPHMKMK